MLITLLLIVSRMNGPAMQLQLDAQHFAHAMPAYEKIRELENDLAAAEATYAGPAGPAIDLPDGPIVFSGVSFRSRCGVGFIRLSRRCVRSRFDHRAWKRRRDYGTIGRRQDDLR